MTTPLSSSQLERVRRDAKKLARNLAIPLHQAQQKLASDRGFANCSISATAIIAQGQPSLFHTWLSTQAERCDAVGDWARDVQQKLRR
jgi:hypothetical protein